MRFIGYTGMGMRMAQWMAEQGMQPLERSAERGVIYAVPYRPDSDRDAFLDKIATFGWQDNLKDPMPPAKPMKRFDPCQEAYIIHCMREAGAFDLLDHSHPLGDAWVHAARAGNLPFESTTNGSSTGPTLRSVPRRLRMDPKMELDLSLWFSRPNAKGSPLRALNRKAAISTPEQES